MKTHARVGRVGIVILFSLLFLSGQCVFSSGTLWAKSENGKGQQNQADKSVGHEPQGNAHATVSVPNRNTYRPPSLRGQATATLARLHIHSAHYKHAGGVSADAAGTGSSMTSVQQDSARTRGNSAKFRGTDQQTEAVKGFMAALERIRAKGDHSGKTKLDPYGLVKDNRMELYGNRGRPVDAVIPEPPPAEEPPPVVEPPVEVPPPAEVPPAPEPEPAYVTVTSSTVATIQLMAWNGETITRQLLSDQGYTSTQIDFLLTQSITALKTAASGSGTLPMP